MTELKSKQKKLLIEWQMISFELDRRHSFVKNRIKFYQISDDLIAKHKNFVTAYAQSKQNIEQRFNDPEFDPPDDAIENAKKELTHQIEQEEEFAEYAKLKDKQQTLIDEWKRALFEFDHIHCRKVNQLKFCDMTDELTAKHTELMTEYDHLKQNIEQRFSDPQYDPPIDALETARREMEHQLDREEEFFQLATLNDRQKRLLDDWKAAVVEYDRRHDLIMNRPLLMCKYLKKKHDQLLFGYAQSKQTIESRFEDPQYQPADDALDVAKNMLTLHLEQEEAFVDHVEGSG